MVGWGREEPDDGLLVLARVTGRLAFTEMKNITGKAGVFGVRSSI